MPMHRCKVYRLTCAARLASEPLSVFAHGSSDPHNANASVRIPGSNKWWFVRIVNSLQRHMHNQGRYSDRRPLCRCLLASEKPTASPLRSPEILFASAPRAPPAGLFLSSRLCAKAATQSDKSMTLSKRPWIQVNAANREWPTIQKLSVPLRE